MALGPKQSFWFSCAELETVCIRKQSVPPRRKRGALQGKPSGKKNIDFKKVIFLYYLVNIVTLKVRYLKYAYRANL